MDDIIHSMPSWAARTHSSASTTTTTSHPDHRDHGAAHVSSGTQHGKGKGKGKQRMDDGSSNGDHGSALVSTTTASKTYPNDMPNGKAAGVTGAETKYRYTRNGGSNGDSGGSRSRTQGTATTDDEGDNENDTSSNDSGISPEDAEALLWDAQVGVSLPPPWGCHFCLPVTKLDLGGMHSLSQICAKFKQLIRWNPLFSTTSAPFADGSHRSSVSDCSVVYDQSRKCWKLNSLLVFSQVGLPWTGMLLNASRYAKADYTPSMSPPASISKAYLALIILTNAMLSHLPS